MAAFIIDYELGVRLKEKSSLGLPKNELFAGICIGFCLLLESSILKRTSDVCFGNDHVFS